MFSKSVGLLHDCWYNKQSNNKQTKAKADILASKSNQECLLFCVNFYVNRDEKRWKSDLEELVKWKEEMIFEI